MSVRKPPPTETWLNQSRPAETKSIPVARIGLKPNRVTSWPPSPAATMIVTRQRQVGEAGVNRAVAEHLLHVQGDEIEHREQRGAEQERRRRSHRSGSAAGRSGRGPAAPSSAARLPRRRRSGPPRRASRLTILVEPQPAVLASSSAYASTERPAVMVTAPAASKWRVADSERLSGIRPGVSASAIAATGTLTQRTHSQPRLSVRMPPSRTPAAPAEPATAPQAPRALLRSAPSLKRLVTIERAAGETIAAPRPWAARAAISWPWVAANPAAERSDPDDDQAGHEDAAPAEQVGSPSAEQQEAAEGDHVGVHDPGQVGLREVQALADARQGDVDDGRIEHHDELRDAEQDQRGPALRRDIPELWSSPSTPFVLCRFSDHRFTLRRMAKAGLDKCVYLYIRNLTSGFG